MSMHAEYDPNAKGQPQDDVLVRPAGPADVRRIAEVHAKRHGDDVEEIVPKVALHLDRIARGELSDYVCVAEVGGRVVAFGKCKLITWPAGADPRLPDGWHLNGVVVEEAHRRRGIGRSITAHRLDWLREQAGADVVYYTANETNRPSVDLHAAFGFEEVARGILTPVRRTDDRQALFRKRIG